MKSGISNRALFRRGKIQGPSGRAQNQGRAVAAAPRGARLPPPILAGVFDILTLN